MLTFNKYHIIESPFKVIARGGSNSNSTTSAAAVAATGDETTALAVAVDAATAALQPNKSDSTGKRSRLLTTTLNLHLTFIKKTINSRLGHQD